MKWIKASERLPEEGYVSVVKILHGIPRIKHAEYFGLINDSPVWKTVVDENGYSFSLYGVIEWLDETPSPDTYASELKQENERLMGLLEKEFRAYRDSDSVDRHWQQFAADNNINPSL